MTDRPIQTRVGFTLRLVILAAILAGVSMLLIGIPGAVFMIPGEMLLSYSRGSQIQLGDRAWPVAIMVSLIWPWFVPLIGWLVWPWTETGRQRLMATAAGSLLMGCLIGWLVQWSALR